MHWTQPVKEMGFGGTIDMRGRKQCEKKEGEGAVALAFLIEWEDIVTSSITWL